MDTPTLVGTGFVVLGAVVWIVCAVYAYQNAPRLGRNAWLWYGANFSPWDREQDPPGSGYHLCEQRIHFLTAADTP